MGDSFVFFNFDNLAGGCDKTNIGAVEVELFSNDALDAILRQIAFVGNPDPSNSQTPTPSRTPTRTPSPSGPCIVFCDCPSFTSQLAYDVDDDNNPDDDQIIYVYVYVDDDGTSFTSFTSFFTSFTSFFTSFTSFFTSFT